MVVIERASENYAALEPDSQASPPLCNRNEIGGSASLCYSLTAHPTEDGESSHDRLSRQPGWTDTSPANRLL